MAIESICAGCGQRLSVADENAGKRARCPSCGHIYQVPFLQVPGGSGGSQFPEPAAQRSELEGGSTDENFARATEPTAPAQFWMKATDGTEYGPVDHQTLGRWFSEGRVGPGYQIRRDEFGTWQSAETFRSAAGTASSHIPSGNPYSENPYQPTGLPGGPLHTYPKSDQGGLILAMGIMSFFLCPLFGIVAWVMGHTALKDIQAGLANPSGKGLVQVGYYLGIASVVLNLLCIGGYIVIIAVALLTGNMN